MPCEIRVRSSKGPINHWGQELISPAANLVPRIGLMAFDAVGEVRLSSVPYSTKGPCGILYLESAPSKGECSRQTVLSTVAL